MLLCLPVSVRAETLPETAKLLPPETILLADIDNFSRLRTQFEKTNFYKLYKDRAMSAFVDDFKTKWREKIRRLDNEFIRVVTDADALPQGRVAIALVLNPPTGGMIGAGAAGLQAGRENTDASPLEVSCEDQMPHRPCRFLTGQAPAGPGAPIMPKLAFTVTDTHLIFASESVVEQAIRALSSAGTASVGSANWFNKAKSAVPSVVGLASLQDNAASGEPFWSALRGLKQSGKKGKAEDSGIKMGVGMSPGSVFLQLMFSQAGSDLFNFSLLPEFDAVRKYFGLSAFYGISRPDGFFFEFKYLNPVSN